MCRLKYWFTTCKISFVLKLSLFKFSSRECKPDKIEKPTLWAVETMTPNQAKSLLKPIDHKWPPLERQASIWHFRPAEPQPPQKITQEKIRGGFWGIKYETYPLILSPFDQNNTYWPQILQPPPPSLNILKNIHLWKGNLYEFISVYEINSST